MTQDEFKVDAPTGFDISQQKNAASQEDEGTDVHIEGVDGSPLFFKKGDKTVPVIIRVAGNHSKMYRRVEERLRKQKIKRSSLTGEKFYEDNIEKVAACVLAWEGFFSDGQPVELTPNNAKMLLKACPWVLDQLTEAMEDHERFFSRG